MDPKTATNSIGSSPNPNQSIANGRVEMAGIGLRIETIVSTVDLILVEKVDTAPREIEIQVLIAKAVKRSFSV